MYSAEKVHVVEVGADQKDHLVGWLSKRVGTPLVAPDLSAEGFQLVGGRLLPAAEKPAAQFMYQDRAGTRISLYVTPDTGKAETGFQLYEEDGARAFSGSTAVSATRSPAQCRKKPCSILPIRHTGSCSTGLRGKVGSHHPPGSSLPNSIEWPQFPSRGPNPTFFGRRIMTALRQI